jgi:citrate lyase subunit beta / citryl-CoA lyase
VTIRLRSLLYTPGDRGDRLAKALREGAADIVCADLEDAVPPERKAVARQATAEALAGPAKALRAVRIQPWPSPGAEEDLAQVLPSRPDIIVVPKVESPGDVATLDARLVGTQCRLILILETARGVLAARELAASSRRVAGVCFGAEDLAADIGAPRSATNEEVRVARGLVVLAATAAGVPALDMITADVRDLERTAREAAEARRLGFRGKMCIHPLQALAIHEAFRPTPEEVAWARKVAAAADAAGAEGGGVVVVDGRMVDVPVIRQARRILEDAA